jgi:hypothetical protein
LFLVNAEYLLLSKFFPVGCYKDFKKESNFPSGVSKDAVWRSKFNAVQHFGNQFAGFGTIKWMNVGSMQQDGWLGRFQSKVREKGVPHGVS